MAGRNILTVIRMRSLVCIGLEAMNEHWAPWVNDHYLYNWKNADCDTTAVAALATHSLFVFAILPNCSMCKMDDNNMNCVWFHFGNESNSRAFICRRWLSHTYQCFRWMRFCQNGYKNEIWNGSLTAVARISSNHLVYEYMRRIHPPQICSCGCVQASAGDRTVCGSQSDRQTDRQIHTANGFMVAQPKNNNKW